MSGEKVRSFLMEHGVRYETRTHPKSFTIGETAEAEHVPGEQMAKVVMLHTDEGLVMAVLPGNQMIDLDKAKALLQEAGQADGFTLELLVPTGAAPGGVAWADLAAKLQADWAKIGVTVNIQQVVQAELLGSYRAQKGQLVMILWGPDFPDPDANAGPFTDISAHSIAFRNSWDDPIAAKSRAAALLTDPAQRAAAYQEITEYVLHNGPYIILYQPTALFGVRSNVKGFVWNSSGFTDFQNISK